jgi:hypothetical protein
MVAGTTSRYYFGTGVAARDFTGNDSQNLVKFCNYKQSQALQKLASGKWRRTDVVLEVKGKVQN